MADGPRYVYQDALAEGWENWSWSTDVDFEQTAVVQEGSNAMRVAYQEVGGGGLSLRSGEVISTTGYEAIRMELHGGDGPSQQLDVLIQFEDSGGISLFQTVTTTPSAWQTVTVLLSDLGSPEAIKRITVQNVPGQTATPFYIDNLRLVDQTEETPEVADNGRVVYPNTLTTTPLQVA